MDPLHAIILSVVEGITEFLPISSTGHMILFGRLFHIPQTEFTKTFEIVIQLGAIGAVTSLYTQTVLRNKKLLYTLITAFIPTSIIGFFAYPFVKHFLLGNPYTTVLALGIGGVAFYAIEYMLKKHNPKTLTIESISFPQALLIGLGQSLSMIPGVSRSAASIFTGMLTGLSRQAAVEFSFLLAIPTMVAAVGYDVYKSKILLSTAHILPLVTGLLIAFITAKISVRLFLKYIQHHTFLPFAIYRILLSIGFWYFILR